MDIMSRDIHIPADLPLVAELADLASEKAPHRVDLPWRLSSPALDDPRNVRLWQAVDGTLLGFAVWQVYWATLDYFVRPGVWQGDVEEHLFAWAGDRFREIDRERGHPLPYWVEARDDDAQRLDALARHGYFEEDKEDYSLLLTLPLRDALTAPDLPAGFAIRPLAGDDEVDDYVMLHRAAFDSTYMTAPWRLRTLHTPRYLPDLDLVAVAPDGTLAGFCVCWLAPDHQSGQIEPMGVHPQFRKLGLARALMRESFRRLHDYGARAVLVEPLARDVPANRAYTDVGFREAHRLVRKGRWM